MIQKKIIQDEIKKKNPEAKKKRKKKKKKKKILNYLQINLELTGEIKKNNSV